MAKRCCFNDRFGNCCVSKAGETNVSWAVGRSQGVDDFLSCTTLGCATDSHGSTRDWYCKPPLFVLIWSTWIPLNKIVNLGCKLISLALCKQLSSWRESSRNVRAVHSCQRSKSIRARNISYDVTTANLRPSPHIKQQIAFSTGLSTTFTIYHCNALAILFKRDQLNEELIQLRVLL